MTSSCYKTLVLNRAPNMFFVYFVVFGLVVSFLLGSPVFPSCIHHFSPSLHSPAGFVVREAADGTRIAKARVEQLAAALTETDPWAADAGWGKADVAARLLPIKSGWVKGWVHRKKTWEGISMYILSTWTLCVYHIHCTFHEWYFMSQTYAKRMRIKSYCDFSALFPLIPWL